jgi:hypothetical protein
MKPQRITHVCPLLDEPDPEPLVYLCSRMLRAAGEEPDCLVLEDGTLLPVGRWVCSRCGQEACRCGEP